MTSPRSGGAWPRPARGNHCPDFERQISSALLHVRMSTAIEGVLFPLLLPLGAAGELRPCCAVLSSLVLAALEFPAVYHSVLSSLLVGIWAVSSSGLLQMVLTRIFLYVSFW